MFHARRHTNTIAAVLVLRNGAPREKHRALADAPHQRPDAMRSRARSHTDCTPLRRLSVRCAPRRAGNHGAVRSWSAGDDNCVIDTARSRPAGRAQAAPRARSTPSSAAAYAPALDRMRWLVAHAIDAAPGRSGQAPRLSGPRRTRANRVADIAPSRWPLERATTSWPTRNATIPAVVIAASMNRVTSTTGSTRVFP